MSKNEVQEYLVELAHKSELPSVNDEEDENAIKEPLYPTLSEEMCNVLSEKLCAEEAEAEYVWLQGERKKKVEAERIEAERVEAERLDKERVDSVLDFSTDDSTETTYTDVTDEMAFSDSSTVDPAAVDAANKQKCTGGCPYKGQIYDSLPMLMRS